MIRMSSMNSRKPAVSQPWPKMVTIRLSHPVHSALVVLAHESRTSVQKLVAGWIESAVRNNEPAAAVLKVQKAIEKQKARDDLR